MQSGSIAAYPYPNKRQLTVTADRVLSTLDLNGIIVVDSSAGPVTITLPDAIAIRAGGFFTVLALNANVNPVSVALAGTDVFNDGTLGPVVLDQAGQELIVLATNTNDTWFIPLAFGTGFADVRNWKESVRAATTAAEDLATDFNPGDTIDGVVLALDDRVLIKNQADAAENGIYVVAAVGAPSRSEDADTGGELVGAVVNVLEGTANADDVFQQVTDPPITLGVTTLLWIPFPIGSLQDTYDASPTGAKRIVLTNGATEGVQVRQNAAGDATQIFSIADNAGATVHFAVDTTGSVGVGTATAAASALLDVTSTTKGFLQPRMTTVQRDAVASPADGLAVHNTDRRRPEFFGDAAWQQVSVVGVDTFEIFTAADLDALASGGVITVTSTTVILLRADITTSNRFDVSGTRFTITNAAQGYSLTYDGSGTLITATDSSIILEASLVATGGGTLFDVSGQQGDIINVDFQASQGWSMGTIRRSPGVPFGPDVFLLHMAVINWQSTLTLENVSVFTVDEIALIPFAGAGVPFIEIKGGTPGSYSVNLVSGSLAAAESLIRVDPGIANASRILVTGSTLDGTLFDTTGGTTGAFSVVAGAAVALTTIDGVTNSSGVARFNFTVGPTVFVGQEVGIVNFVTETSYNQTGIITATGAGFFEVETIAFAGDDTTGDFSSASVTLTDAAHGLSELDTLVIDTDLSTEYDGGATIYNVLTNTFQVNRPFNGTATGSWDTAGVGQTDPRVLAVSNPRFEDSGYIGSVNANANAVATTITTINTWVDANLGTLAVGSSNIERFKLLDTTTGEVEYTGLEPFSGFASVNMSGFGQAGQDDYEFRILVNGSPTSDAIVSGTSTNTNGRNVGLLAPVVLVTGDLVRFQIQNISGTDDFTFENVAMVIE